MIRRLIRSAALLLSCLAFSASVSAYTLSVAPASLGVAQGSGASVVVNLSGYDQLVGVGGYNFTLSFDPTVLALGPGAVTPLFAPGLPADAVFDFSIAGGSVTVSFFSFISIDLDPIGFLELLPQDDPLPLVAFDFSAIGPGVSPLSIGNFDVSGALGEFLENGQAAAGSVTVEARAVPEPTSLALIAGALLALGMVLSRRRAVALR